MIFVIDFEDNDADIFNLDGIDPELSFDDRTSIESLTSDTNDSQSDQEGSESVGQLEEFQASELELSNISSGQRSRSGTVGEDSSHEVLDTECFPYAGNREGMCELTSC